LFLSQISASAAGGNWNRKSKPFTMWNAWHSLSSEKRQKQNEKDQEKDMGKKKSTFRIWGCKLEWFKKVLPIPDREWDRIKQNL